MILTDKDAKTLENNNKFKSVELNDNFVNADMAKKDRPKTPVDIQISLYETKKLNESHQQNLKD